MWLNLHLGNFFPWERCLDAQFSISPRYLSTIAFWLTKSSNYRHDPWWVTTPSFPRTRSLGQVLPIPLQMPWHMSTPRAVSHCPHDQVRTGFPYPPEGVGWHQKVLQWCCLATSTTKRGCSRREGVQSYHGVVHPYQARVSMIDDVAKQLTQLASTGPDWPYALVQLNGDACHMPLPTEGHLSVMTEGNTSNVPCGKICQLEVCQLLSSWLLGGLPRRTQWVSSSSGNVSAWVAIQWHKYAWR